MDTDARIKRLERSMWVWRGLALALGVAVLVGMTRAPSKVLECEKLIVRDPRSKAYIQIDYTDGHEDPADSSAWVVFNSRDGKSRDAFFMVSDDIAAFAAEGIMYTSLGLVLENAMEVVNEDGEIATRIGSTVKGDGYVEIRNAAGQTAAVLSATAHQAQLDAPSAYGILVVSDVNEPEDTRVFTAAP